MGGLAGIEITFPGTAPAFGEIAAAAEKLGSLPIVGHQEQGQLVVSFAQFPEGKVTIKPSDAATLFVCDFSMKAPTLYRLLCETLVLMGGTRPCHALEPLRLPLTTALVKSDLRTVYFASMVMSLLLVAAVLGTLAVGGFVLWWLLRNAT